MTNQPPSKNSGIGRPSEFARKTKSGFDEYSSAQHYRQTQKGSMRPTFSADLSGGKTTRASSNNNDQEFA